MKSHYEAEQVIRDIKKKICNCRLGAYYINVPKEEEYPTNEQIYNEGFKEGVYQGLEMALGLLESVEEEWTDESDL